MICSSAEHDAFRKLYNLTQKTGVGKGLKKEIEWNSWMTERQTKKKKVWQADRTTDKVS